MAGLSKKSNQFDTEPLPADGGSDTNTVAELSTDADANSVGAGSVDAETSGGGGGDIGGDGARDPASGVDTGARKRKRDTIAGTSASAGRGAAARSGAQKDKLGLTKDGGKLFATQLVGVHKVLGMVTGYGDVMEITESEADSMASAITDVLAQYKIKLNPKVVAWSNLAGICAAVYAPKIIMIAAHNKQMRDSRQSQPGNTDTPIPAANVSTLNFG